MGDRRPRVTGRVAVPAEWGVEARMARLEEIIQDAVFFGAVREKVNAFAREIDDARQAGRLAGELEELVYVDAALAMMHRACPYRRDPAGEDWHQDTATTLVEGGDCEDLATLLAALLRLGAYFYGLRLKTRLVWMRREGGQDHVAVQVRVGDGHDTGDDPDGGWEWLEPSIVGARRGEHPEAAGQRLGVLR